MTVADNSKKLSAMQTLKIGDLSSSQLIPKGPSKSDMLIEELSVPALKVSQKLNRGKRHQKIAERLGQFSEFEEKYQEEICTQLVNNSRSSLTLMRTQPNRDRPVESSSHPLKKKLSLRNTEEVFSEERPGV